MRRLFQSVDEPTNSTSIPRTSLCFVSKSMTRSSMALDEPERIPREQPPARGGPAVSGLREMPGYRELSAAESGRPSLTVMPG